MFQWQNTYQSWIFRPGPVEFPRKSRRAGRRASTEDDLSSLLLVQLGRRQSLHETLDVVLGDVSLRVTELVVEADDLTAVRIRLLADAIVKCDLSQRRVRFELGDRVLLFASARRFRSPRKRLLLLFDVFAVHAKKSNRRVLCAQQIFYKQTPNYLREDQSCTWVWLTCGLC